MEDEDLIHAHTMQVRSMLCSSPHELPRESSLTQLDRLADEFRLLYCILSSLVSPRPMSLLCLSLYLMRLRINPLVSLHSRWAINRNRINTGCHKRNQLLNVVRPFRPALPGLRLPLCSSTNLDTTERRSRKWNKILNSSLNFRRSYQGGSAQ